MPKPIIYGTSRSPAVRSVLLTAYAINLDFDLKELDMAANEHKSEAFLKKNPQHTIPTLEDGDKCIWDSHAIITYLVSKYGKDDSLYPKDLYKRALVDQRLHFESSVLGMRLFSFAQSRRTKNPEEMSKADAGLNEAYEFLEKFIGNNDYLAGKTLTVADFSILPSLSTISTFAKIDPEKFPKLSAWMNRMKKLPYYEKGNGEGLVKCVDYITKTLGLQPN